MNQPPDQAQPPPQRPPERPWFDKPRGRLNPDEVDELDKRLGRTAKSRKLFL
jgi:hypothetical protein